MAALSCGGRSGNSRRSTSLCRVDNSGTALAGCELLTKYRDVVRSWAPSTLILVGAASAGKQWIHGVKRPAAGISEARRRRRPPATAAHHLSAGTRGDLTTVVWPGSGGRSNLQNEQPDRLAALSMGGRRRERAGTWLEWGRYPLSIVGAVCSCAAASGSGTMAAAVFVIFAERARLHSGHVRQQRSDRAERRSSWRRHCYIVAGESACAPPGSTPATVGSPATCSGCEGRVVGRPGG